MISHGITASCRFGVANQTDVYLIGPDGGLNISSAVGGGPWSDLFGPQPGALFQPGAAVAASAQYGLAQTDVFAVGTNGQLYVMWADGDDSWNNPYPIGATGVFPPGAAVAASAQYGLLDTTVVFAVGNAGQLTVSWVGQDRVWHGPATIGATGVFPPGAAVAASAQYGLPDTTDVFAVNNNSEPTVTWVGQDRVWQGPANLTPDPQITLPIIEDPSLTVTGTHFTPSGEVWLKYWVTGNNGPTPATLEHPGFGGDSILPRCSGLGGRCLPRYRRLAEPRSDHFSAFVYRTSVQLRCPDARLIWRGFARPGTAGAGVSPRRAPAVRRGFPGRGQG